MSPQLDELHKTSYHKPQGTMARFKLTSQDSVESEHGVSVALKDRWTLVYRCNRYQMTLPIESGVDPDTETPGLMLDWPSAPTWDYGSALSDSEAKVVKRDIADALKTFGYAWVDFFVYTGPNT